MLEKIKYLIDYYELNYRKEGLEKFRYFEPYSFNSKVQIDCVDVKNTWPESWEIGSSRGVYAIFHHEQLLYIGKASQQEIGRRISAHFQHSHDKTHAIPKGNWSKIPTHFVAWGVPNESFFEASALEEFLISELKDYLSDNTIGKRA